MPDFKREIAEKLAPLHLPPAREKEIIDELSAHLQERYRELTGAGAGKESARRAAIEELGDGETLARQLRSTETPVSDGAEIAGQRGRLRAGIWGDLRYGMRQLRQNRAFAIVAVVTLAIGIGATSAIFSVVAGVFWKPVAVKSPQELRGLSWTAPQKKNPDGSFSYAAYARLRDGSKSFSDVACSWGARAELSEWGLLPFQLVSGNYFRMLGVNAILGRIITPADDQPDNPTRVAVISYSLWQRALGGDTHVLERTIPVKGVSFQIVGVLPDSFVLDPTNPRDVMLPLAAQSLVTPTGRNPWLACGIIARLRPGISDEQARAEGEALLREAMIENPPKDSDNARLLLTDPLDTWSRTSLRKRSSLPLYLMLSAAGTILVITCANIAGLLLARGRSRQKELATRFALGARRGRIVRQLLTESLLLSAIGGSLGIGLSYAMAPFLPELLSELGWRNWLNPAFTLRIDLTPDLRVLGFSVALTALTGIVFGLLPSLRTTQVDLVSMMKQSAGAAAPGRLRMRSGKLLVTVQVAFSMLLLVGAGLLIRTVLNLTTVPVGYDPAGLVFVEIDPSSTAPAVVAEAAQRLAALPGVASSAVSQWPIYNNAEPKFPICGSSENPGEFMADIEPVTPHFFETWGVRMLSGRDFSGLQEPSVIVNEAYARKFFAGRDPVGQQMGMGRCPGTPRTIIGMVADHRDRERVEIAPMVYIFYPMNRVATPSTFAVRTAGDPHLLVPAVRRIMAELNTNVDGDVITGTDYKAREIRTERVLAGLLVFFGSLALVISCLGMYGLLTYTVSRRTPEIGIRMALGAHRPEVIRMVVRELLFSVASGIVVGCLAAFALTRMIQTLLFGVSRHNPWIIAAAVSIVVIAAAIAAVVPAKRASGIDPVRALRYE